MLTAFGTSRNKKTKKNKKQKNDKKDNKTPNKRKTIIRRTKNKI
jgi:hypothetical protein